MSGSTCVSCLIAGSHLWVANVGDSRAVLGRQGPAGVSSVRLTVDQKPDLYDQGMLGCNRVCHVNAHSRRGAATQARGACTSGRMRRSGGAASG